jgi:hypothetical protein
MSVQLRGADGFAIPQVTLAQKKRKLKSLEVQEDLAAKIAAVTQKIGPAPMAKKRVAQMSDWEVEVKWAMFQFLKTQPLKPNAAKQK